MSFLFFFFSDLASNPKHSKQRVEDQVVGDDIVMGRDVPSIIVDPSTSSAGAAPRQTPPSASLQVDAAASGVAPGQTSPSAYKLVPLSTLGAALAPNVLKAKKLDIKKSLL